MPRFLETKYFQHTRRRPDRRMISDEWIERVIAFPDEEGVQEDGRIRRWKRIPEFENRALRVTLLSDARTVHNAFFDRGYEETQQ